MKRLIAGLLLVCLFAALPVSGWLTFFPGLLLGSGIYAVLWPSDTRTATRRGANGSIPDEH